MNRGVTVPVGQPLTFQIPNANLAPISAEPERDRGRRSEGARRSVLVEGGLLVRVDLEDLVEPGDPEDFEEIGMDAAEF